MIVYEIPGRESLVLENLVLDYNGTIASSGKLLDGVKELIELLSRDLNVYILTADTYGSVNEECSELKAELLTFPREGAGKAKKEIVEKLGREKTVCIGNGYNDIAMAEICALSLAVLEEEGTSGKLLARVDIVARSILEALNILANPMMVKATLRN